MADLQPYLGDDQMIAGAEVISGRPPYAIAGLTAVAGLVVDMFTISARMHILLAPHHRSGLLLFMVIFALPPSAIFPLLALRAHRPVLVAVTQRQVLCCELTGFRKRLKRVHAVALNGARVTGYRKGRRTTSVTLEGLATKPWRLHAIKDKRPDLDRMLAAASALGVVGTAMNPPGGQWALQAHPELP